MEANTDIQSNIQFVAIILHDFKKKVVVLRPNLTTREEITYEEYDKYIGFDLLKEN